MAAWVCAACTTPYAVGAPACPHCGATSRTEQGGGSVLPCITVACRTRGCPTEGAERRVILRAPTVGLVELPNLLCAACGATAAVVRPWPPTEEGEDMPKITSHGGPTNAADEGAQPPGEEDPSPGISSSTSSAKPKTKPAPKPAGPRKRARTTENPSEQARTGGSTARGTGGDPTAPTSAKGSDG